ncbi:MAG: DUF6438 domain-containing protein [Mucilaginibacter sp.]|uniref:DUF6438 domain-containing protein n=1 Tax=Mucilaginibacter sp. TaxID=1882438 RepID=UPI0032653F11
MVIKRISILFFIFCYLIGCKQKSAKAPFAKIIYHTSECYGWCPVYHLEVDSNKILKLYSEMAHRNAIDNSGDSTKIGYFTGKIADTTFTKLQNAVTTLGIDTVKFRNITCCDGALKTIIIYHDGKRKFLRSMFPPKAANNLISLLQGICEQNNLQRASSKFNIESGDTVKVSDVRYPPKQ